MHNSPTAPTGTRLNSSSEIKILVFKFHLPIEDESIFSVLHIEVMNENTSVRPYAFTN